MFAKAYADGHKQTAGTGTGHNCDAGPLLAT